ncbi:hypothetical protein FOZ62_031681 [Perkinsus olseni]|uniref:Uncharacterized protein n=2 Tax=Perkinsus olseni TaxID=32597 RepID=A0A7J6PRQ5_PEROL|nr:hypothetical protein FOZ62_031681 [Perkinsus olseni]
MSIPSVLFAAVVGAVVCQENTVSVLQRRVSFQNGSTRDIFTSPSGTLRLIQTLELQDAVSPRSQFEELSSFLVTSKGEEMLATNDDGLFICMELKPKFDDQFDVSKAFVYPMRDPQGDRITDEDHLDTARGLAIDGTYRGEGRGELFVSYTEGRRMLKFPIGVDSRTSAEVDISLVLDECRNAPQAIDIMRPDPLLPANLAMICDKPTRIRGSIYPAFAYVGDVPIRFEVESDDGFFPVDMAGLSDGSLMILFRGPNRRSGRRTMRIGLASSRDLSLAMRRREGRVTPQIILEVAESDGFNIGLTSGLATREHDDKIFVYIVNDGVPITYLTNFEWIP